MATCRSPSENTGKMNLIPVLNKTPLRAHTELELDVLGVHKKLVKYLVVQMKKLNFFNFTSHKLPKQQSTVFGLKAF
jgi:hypothetical protein